MDYWEVGYKQAMERLVEIENSDTIRYHLPNYPLLYPLKTQKTFVFCADENTGQPEYFISNYRYHPQDYPYAKIDSIMADGNEIIGIYRLR